MTNMLSTVTSRTPEILKSDNFHQSTLQHGVFFARNCVWASFQMSRSVGTCIRGCQNYCFSNTQDTLNIHTLENVQASSQTQFFCTGPGALIQSVLRKMEKKAEAVMKSDSCKNSNDIAGQSIDNDWHVSW